PTARSTTSAGPTTRPTVPRRAERGPLSPTAARCARPDRPSTRSLSMTSWNFADLWEICAEVRDGTRAQVHGDRVVSWTKFNQRANGIARTLLDAGFDHHDKVAQYL